MTAPALFMIMKFTEINERISRFGMVVYSIGYCPDVVERTIIHSKWVVLPRGLDPSVAVNGDVIYRGQTLEEVFRNVLKGQTGKYEE